MRTRSSNEYNKNNNKFTHKWCIDELHLKIKNYINQPSLRIIAEHNWRSNGNKQNDYFTYLIKFINTHWDDIFDYDDIIRSVKIQAMTLISSYQNEYECKYIWVDNIKELIYDAIIDADANDKITTQLVNKKIILLENRFNTSFIQYNNCYSDSKKAYIKCFIKTENIVQLRSVFLFMNRHYFTLFTFNDVYNRLIKSVSEKMREYIESAQYILHSNVCNISQQRQLILAIKTFRNITQKNTLKIGTVIYCILNRIFYKDITLYITDFL